MDEQEFIDDYENIISTIESLINDTTSEELRDDLISYLDDFKLNYLNTKEECESSLQKEHEQEVRQQEREYWNSQL